MNKIEVSALASGSSGNCFYVSAAGKAILIDAGISTKRIIERLNSIGKSPESIKAIFITHEHIDHIRGADVFARQFNIPVFATKKVIDGSFICSNEKLIRPMKNNSSVKIAGMEVKSFTKSHDAVDPIGFFVSFKGKNVSIITDAGHVCDSVSKHISKSDFIFLESNHDEEMLFNGPYPYHLKKLISSDIGHLSNKQAALSVLEYASSKLKGVVLSHLSSTNNTPEIAIKTFENYMKERINAPEIHVSLKDAPTELFKI
jgi:phosphoribosyl 1,2-cyclic phosphodiesterase